MSRLLWLTVAIVMAASCHPAAPGRDQPIKELDTPDLQSALDGWVAVLGEGSVLFLARGGLVIYCKQDPLPFSAELGFEVDLKPQPVYAGYEFTFPSEQILRLSSVVLETNLPTFPAYAYVEREVLNEYDPQTKVGLEFRLILASLIVPDEPHAENAFLVCTRLVRYFDDNDLGQTLGGSSWLYDTPVFAPTRESGQVGRIPSRSKESFPWACTVIRLAGAKGFRGWFPAYVREEKEPPGKWAFLTIAEGSYSPRPERWPQDKGPEAKPAEGPAPTTR